MKHILTTLFVVILALSILSATGAMAAQEPIPAISVTGTLVEFPDAKPYIDAQNRTVAPVRFIGEALGAEVSWDNARRTAVLRRDKTRVEIPIDSRRITVVRDGISEAVIMDTTAVIYEDRTYVPVRYVAEALGAYVDYSNVYKTVSVFDDVLTKEQISELMSLSYTRPKSALGYEEAKKRYDAETLAFYYGTDRDSFQIYANAREHLYHMTSEASVDEYYADVVSAAVSAVSYDSETLSVRFLADTSCIYQSDSMDRLTCAVRGIAVAELKTGPMELPARETAILCALGFTRLEIGMMYVPVDIHMNASAGSAISVHTVAPAGDQY